MVLFGMVVRERRRIASLARTASSLDERVQAAEAAAVAKDSAFRAYVDEQRNEIAILTQNQQEQILSLMDMVRDEAGVASARDEAFEDDSKDKSVEDRDTTRAEGHTNPALLVLANERISVLERQLRELRSGNEAIKQHRHREEEARSELQKKANECNQLEDEIRSLRTALRQVRDEMWKTETDFGDRKERSQPPAAVLDIVARALHPSGEASTPKSRTPRSRVPKSDVPLKLRNDSFADTTDSEGVPDWADDIMADLAIIAEGKMPSSLLGSTAAKDSQEHTGDQNVFDRLTNPTAFTGVQKQKQTNSKPKTKSRSSSQPPSSGQRQRKLISKQVADSLEKVEIPSVPEQPKKDVFDRLLSPSNLTGTQKQRFNDKKEKNTSWGSTGGEGNVHDGENLANEDSYSSRETRLKPEASAEDDILDDLLSGGDDEAVNKADSSNVDNPVAGSKKRGDYAKQDVFQRLQTTTTAAYAVKQHENIAEKMLHDLLDTEESANDSHPKIEHPAFERIDGYVKQDVFERLQKTSTESFSASAGKKIHHNSDHVSTARTLAEHTHKFQTRTDSPSRNRTAAAAPPEPKPDYVRQNVFERLTRTPTEAFKGKSNT